MRRAAILAAALALVAVSAVAAQAPAVVYPDTPVGKKMALYQEALATGDPEVLRAFLKAHHTGANADAMVDQEIQVRNQSGGFIPFAVDPRSTPTAMAVKAKSSFSGREFQQIMAVEAAPPHKITAIGLANGGYDVAGFLAGKR